MGADQFDPDPDQDPKDASCDNTRATHTTNLTASARQLIVIVLYRAGLLTCDQPWVIRIVQGALRQ